jgi:hypothetical protein
MSPTKFAAVGRLLAAVPILFAVVYSSCGQGTGFTLSVQVGGFHLAASTCR